MSRSNEVDRRTMAGKGSAPPRQRGRRGLPGDPLWNRAPFVLFHFPGVLVAIFVASVVVGLAGAAGPLFLTSADDGALRESLAGASDRPTLTVVAYTSSGGGDTSAQDRILRAATAQVGDLGSAVRTVVSNGIQMDGPSGRPLSVQPIGRTGFLDHVDVVAGGDRPGIWVPDTIVRRFAAVGGLRPGDPIRLATGRRAISETVAGVYRDLSTLPTTDYWAPLSTFIRSPQGQPAPPPLIFADDTSIARIERDLGLAARVQWEYRLRGTDLTLPAAGAKAGQVQDLVDRITSPATPLGKAFPGDSAFTSLPAAVGRARAAASSLVGPIRTVSLAGQVLSLAGIAASALFSRRRRRIELRLLAVRGEGPVRLAVRSAVESLPGLVLGGAAGWALAVTLVRTYGPPSVVQASALRSAATHAAVSVGLGIVLVAVAAGVSHRAEGDEVTARTGELAARFPWEAVALALAAAAWYELLIRGASPTPTGHVDQLLLLFPFLFIAGSAGLTVRGLRLVLARMPARGGETASPGWWALRRLAAAPRIATVMVAAAGLAVGVLVYAAVLVQTSRAAGREKALVAVGAATAVPLQAGVPLPLRPDVPITEVVEIRGGTTLAPSNLPVDVLGVDPGTFGGAAAWDPRYASRPLADLLDGLRGSTPGRLRAVVAGGRIPPGSTFVLSGGSFPLQVIGTASAFPGMHGRRILLVVDRTTLLHLAAETRIAIGGIDTRWEVWSPAAPGAVTAALRSTAAGAAAGAPHTAAREESGLAFLALSWSFGFLEALGCLAGVMALVGLLLYLQARQQAREVAYALARRMGLSKSAHGRSVATELTGMLGAAFAAGAAFAWVASRLVLGRLDPLPALPPGPTLRVPVGLLGLTALALAGAALAGAAIVQRRADRVNVAEVMRRAG